MYVCVLTCMWDDRKRKYKADKAWCVGVGAYVGVWVCVGVCLCVCGL